MLIEGEQNDNNKQKISKPVGDKTFFQYFANCTQSTGHFFK